MYPLFGWHKASYINLVSVLGTFAFLALAALPISTAGVAGFLLLIGNLQVGQTQLHHVDPLFLYIIDGPNQFTFLCADCNNRSPYGRTVRWLHVIKTTDWIDDGEAILLPLLQFFV
jgi:hypothetical protein